MATEDRPKDGGYGGQDEGQATTAKQISVNDKIRDMIYE
jgi:hypothetical protein